MAAWTGDPAGAAEKSERPAADAGRSHLDPNNAGCAAGYDGSFTGGGVGRPPPEDDDDDDEEDDGGGELRDDSTCGAGALRGDSALGDSNRGDSVLGEGDALRGV